MSDLTTFDITKASAGLEKSAFSAQDLLHAYLKRIGDHEKHLNCYITLLSEQALIQAKASDERRSKGRSLSPIDGIPIAVKDNIDLAGILTTNGMAKLLTPKTHSFVVQTLLDAGAVIMGKTNMHEGALGATTNNFHHGACHNPWRHGYTPGGSSGGSAAAVAARLCAGALGTDTMGSVRLPAAYCGVTGMKPSYGLISTNGVVPLSHELDHVGPICRSVSDLSLLMAILSVFDPHCAQSISPGDALKSGIANLQGLRFAIPLCTKSIPFEQGIWDNFMMNVQSILSHGAVQIDKKLINADPTGTRLAGLLVSEAEASVNLANKLRSHPEYFSNEFAKMLDYGKNISSHKLINAQQILKKAGRSFIKLFDEVDILLLPTSAQAAFSFKQATPSNQADLTQWANHSGCPAITLPSGLSTSGMPLGLQLIGPPQSDGTLLSQAEAISTLLPELRAPEPSEKIN